MSDIDYHSIYTQFLTECDKKVRPPAIVMKGFLGKNENPTTKVHIYHILPSVINDNVVKSILHNSNHPAVTKFKIVKKKEQTLDRQLRVESIDYGGSTNVTFGDILRIVDNSVINIILMDSVLLDYTSFDYIYHITPQTIGVLSSKPSENHDYVYSIDNFNGFIFNGKPDVDVPYYINFYGSRHLFIKKFYSNKYNIVNVAKLIPCYMMEYNMDCFNKENSYLHNQSFSIAIVQPQSNTETINVKIDEKDILRYRDSKPLDSIITFSNLQTDIETILPLIKRVGISELENTLKINMFQSYQRELETKQKKLTDMFQAYEREMKTKIEQDQYKQEEELQKKLKLKVDELHNKYAELEKDFENGFAAIKNERMKELDEEAEREYEIMRSQRIVSIENESKTLFQALDAQYNDLLEQRKEKLEDYEKSERDRIDREINNLYSEKYDEISKKIDIRKLQLEDEVNAMKEIIVNRVKEEVRSDFILKYNEEYADAISQMNKFIEYRRNAAIVNIEQEIQSFKNRKHDELNAWEKIRHAAVEKRIHEYELKQQEIVKENCEKYQKTRFEDVELLIQHKYTIECESNKRKLDEDFETLRIKTLMEANQHASHLIEEKTTALNAELESIRNEQLTSSKLELNTQRELLIQNMKAEVENIRRQRIQEVEDESNKLARKLADEREQVIANILESRISLKETEINSRLAMRQAEAENKYAAKVSELEKNMYAKITQLQQDLEHARKTEQEKLVEYEKHFKESMKAHEKRLRDDALANRYMLIETEIASKRNELNSQLQNEFIKTQTEIKKQVEELRQNEIQTMYSQIQSQKTIKEKELQSWLLDEKHKLELQLADERTHIEKTLKDFYELKKFEFAESFTKETSEIEKSRIAFHNRELSRIKEDIESKRDEKVKELMQNITNEVEHVKTHKYSEMLTELEKYKEQRIQEIENELKESERKRKVKIREMQDMINKMN